MDFDALIKGADSILKEEALAADDRAHRRGKVAKWGDGKAINLDAAAIAARMQWKTTGRCLAYAEWKCACGAHHFGAFAEMIIQTGTMGATRYVAPSDTLSMPMDLKPSPDLITTISTHICIECAAQKGYAYEN